MKKQVIKDWIINIGISGIFLWITLIGLFCKICIGGDFGS